jgi:hypothetical protein
MSSPLESSAAAAAPPTSRATSAPSSPARSAATLSVVGALLAIAGFFLPWEGAYRNSVQPAQSPSLIPVSGWDIVTRLAFGIVVPSQSNTPISSVPYAVMAATPLLMALVALAIGLITFIRGPGSVLSGLYTAAALMGLLFLMYDVPAFLFLNLGEPVIQEMPKDAPLTGIGINLLQLGFFLLLAGGVAGAIQQSRQAAR